MAEETKIAEQCDPPNTYPLARRVLGRYAPGTRRASGLVPVIADVMLRKNPRMPRNEHSICLGNSMFPLPRSALQPFLNAR